MIELLKQNTKNSLLIVHHPLDIESDINDLGSFGHRAVSNDLLRSYKKRGNYFMKKGLLIEFSGVDGSGKSTQTQLLCDALRERGYNCILLDFYERKFQDIINKKEGCCSIRDVFTTETSELLMLCDELIYREDYVRLLIEEENVVVLARSLYDRYLKSRLYDANNSFEIKKLIEYSLLPNVHFYLSVNIDNCIKRIAKRGTDTENATLMKKYIDILEAESKLNNRIYIDSNKSIAEIHKSILTYVLNLME